MLFLSLFMDLMLLFGGPASIDLAASAGGTVEQHATHGHLPGATDGHNGTTHLHHGQHGHGVGPSGGEHHL